MPKVKQIDIAKIFEKAAGRPLPRPKPYVSPPLDKPTIADGSDKQ